MNRVDRLESTHIRYNTADRMRATLIRQTMILNAHIAAARDLLFLKKMLVERSSIDAWSAEWPLAKILLCQTNQGCASCKSNIAFTFQPRRPHPLFTSLMASFPDVFLRARGVTTKRDDNPFSFSSLFLFLSTLLMYLVGLFEIIRF